MQLDKLKQMTAITVLNSMMSKPFFSICAITEVADMLNIPVHQSESYGILRTLHCVNFNKMPDEIRKAIPELIKDCLSSPSLTFVLASDHPVIDLPFDFPEPKLSPVKKLLRLVGK